MSLPRPLRSSVPRPRADATTFLTAYLLLLVAIPSRLTFAPLGAAGTPAQLLGIAGAGWWLAHRLALRPASGAGAPVRRAMVVFSACVLVSFVKAMTRPIDEAELNAARMALLSVVSWLGVLLVAHDGITDRGRLDVLVRRLTLAAALLGAFGLVQFVTGKAYTELIQVPGLTPNIPLYGVASRDGLARPAATALSPIEFGVFLTVCLPLAVHMALDAQGGIVRRWLPTMAVAVVIPLSISRSAIIGTAIVLCFLLPSWPRARRHGAYLTILAVLTSVFVLVPGMLGSIVKLFTGLSDDQSALSRTDSYPLAWEFVARAPLFGRGFLTFLPKYRILDNQYLGLLIDMGVFGLLALLALFLVGVRVALRLRRYAVRDADRSLALSLAAALSATAASFAFFDAFSFPLISGLLFLLLGCVGALQRTVSQSTPEDAARASREAGKRIHIVPAQWSPIPG